MPKPKPALGHINFRLDLELHQELLEIARALGTDLSGLLKEMLKEALPAFSARAVEAVARQHTSVAARVETLLGLIREPVSYSRWEPSTEWVAAWRDQLQQLRELKEGMERDRAEREREREEREER
jgi:post-segregation antitoxin (ccd killing protein)